MRWLWRILAVVAAGAIAAPGAGSRRPDGAPASSSPLAVAAGFGGTAEGRGVARIATWNIRWFPDGTYEDATDAHHATDVAWVAREIRDLAAPVVAVQEFKRHERARAASDRLLQALDLATGGRWKLVLDDCPHDGQPHLGFLFDTTRVEASDVRTIDVLNPHAERCDGAQHPGLSARFVFPGGLDLDLVNVHLAAGETADDLALRRETYEALAGAYQVAAQRGEHDVVFLGDFNTNGCPDCDASLTSNDEIDELARTLDGIRPALALLPADATCSEYFEGVPYLLDHVAAPTAMAEAEGATADVRGYCVELGCMRQADDESLPPAAHRLSDHCPIVVSLRDVDAD